MARKSLGYTELEWTCPYCNGRNPGTATKCGNCGSPQPEDVEFHQPAQEKIIADEAKIKRAKAGPDIICAYCTTRNPATATHCQQCGADLSEGSQREVGGVIGSHRKKAASDIACEFCGTLNSADAYKCSNCGANIGQVKAAPEVQTKAPPPKRQNRSFQAIAVVAIIAICSLCAFFAYLTVKTESATGQVTNIEWERTIVIEGLGPVTQSDWQDQIPNDALSIGSCQEKVRTTSDNPAPNSREVCGTPYTIDTGTGMGEVVQDCRYEIYDNYCQYTVEAWGVVDEVRVTGNDRNPQWPQINLSSTQRQGEQDESYTVYFSNDGEQYTLTTGDFNEYTRYQVGSTWNLEVNTFGSVTSAEPAP